MKKSILKLTASLVALTAVSALAQTQPAASSAAAPSAPAPSAWDQWVKEVKNPTLWFSWGADLRLRNEYVNNAATLSDSVVRHEQDYFRFRGRLWTAFTPLTNVNVNARVAAEPREWMEPSFAGQYGARTGFEERYAIVDLLNLKWNNIFDQPLTLTLGRQEILLGDPDDWWLVCDGTPNDGSWTFFLDSIRLGYEAKEIKTKFDVIYLYQNALPDEWIPTLGRSSKNVTPTIGSTAGSLKRYSLTDQDEQGVILYVSNKSIKNVQVDGYFIYKRDNKIAEVATGDSADIYTLGSKITGTPAEHWSYSVEGAYQFGSKQDAAVGTDYVNSKTDWRDISACGGKVRLSYLFKDPLKNQVNLIGEYLSGDDPNTKGKDEMFDILWGRYPRWSELTAPFYYAGETGGRAAQLNNLGRVGPSWSFSPIKGMTFSAMYNALFAPEAIPTRVVGSVAPRFSNDGNFRGHYLQTILKHQFNKNLSVMLKDEFLWEGDYYAQTDVMTFIRAEMTLTF